MVSLWGGAGTQQGYVKTHNKISFWWEVSTSIIPCQSSTSTTFIYSHEQLKTSILLDPLNTQVKCCSTLLDNMCYMLQVLLICTIFLHTCNKRRLRIIFIFEHLCDSVLRKCGTLTGYVKHKHHADGKAGTFVSWAAAPHQQVLSSTCSSIMQMVSLHTITCQCSTYTTFIYSHVQCFTALCQMCSGWLRSYWTTRIQR